MSNTWKRTFECSACGGYSPEEYDFCPHCGADMRLTASNEKKHKTYIEDFFEKFPKCVRGYEDGMPPTCRDLIYRTCNKECSNEPNCCVACWNAEMEDADE